MEPAGGVGNEVGSSLGSPSEVTAVVWSQAAVQTLVPLLGCAPVSPPWAVVGTLQRGRDGW